MSYSYCIDKYARLFPLTLPALSKWNRKGEIVTEFFTQSVLRTCFELLHAFASSWFKKNWTTKTRSNTKIGTL